MKTWQRLSYVFLAALILGGCKGTPDKGGIAPVANVDTGHSRNDQYGDGDALKDIDSQNISFDPSNDLSTVYFAFDSSDLDPPARDVLQEAAAYLEAHPTGLIQIAGHCDERGTQEYNLALGERRAQSVRDYLRQLGVPGDRLITISYGEEVPVDTGSNESAWAGNRRCEFAEAQ